MKFDERCFVYTMN